ncbi:MAG: tetratricopeptide repeat protein [Candidatus Eremiobacteraeota bacterium]|nr:tetratricopeptide repeat protein [Candidatus Eremiobacteraeota bacterium]
MMGTPSADDLRVLERLAELDGGFDRTAAASLAKGKATRPLLDRLVQRKLLTADARSAFVRRYAEYAKKLDGEYGQSDSTSWLARYEAEMPNILAAFDAAVLDGDLHASAVELAMHTHWYWHELGKSEEGLHMVERALGLPELSLVQKARLTRIASTLEFVHGDFAASVTWGERALEHALDAQPAESVLKYYTALANALLYGGRYDEAEQYYRLALDAAQREHDDVGISICKFNLSIYMSECKGDFAASRRLLEESFQTKTRDEYDEALTAETQSRLAYLERNLDDAVKYSAHAFELLTKLGNVEHTLELGMRRVTYLAMRGDLAQAELLYGAQHRTLRRTSNWDIVALALDSRATLFVAHGELARAIETRAFLERFRAAHHLAVFPVERRYLDAWDFAALSLLGREAHAAARAQGAARDPEAYLSFLEI